MMGRLASDRSKFFYEFHVDDHVPSEHLVRRIDAVLDPSWLRAKLSPFFSHMDVSVRLISTGHPMPMLGNFQAASLRDSPHAAERMSL